MAFSIFSPCSCCSARAFSSRTWGISCGARVRHGGDVFSIGMAGPVERKIGATTYSRLDLFGGYVALRRWTRTLPGRDGGEGEEGERGDEARLEV